MRSKVSHAFRDGERQTLLSRERDDLLVLLHNQDKGGTASSTHNNAADGTHVATTGSPPHVLADQPQSDSIVASSGSDHLLSLATILTSMGQSSDPVRQHAAAASSVSNQMNVLPATASTASNRMKALSSLAASSLSVYQHGSSAAKFMSSKKTASTKKSRAGAKPPAVTSPIAASLQTYCQQVDVVFGRGAPLRQHPGNITFRNTVAKFSENYLDGTKHRKTEIIQSVIRELEAVGARFLIMNDQGSGVTEATQDEIRMKVSHRFRDFPKSSSGSNKKKEEGITTKSPKKTTTVEPVENTQNPQSMVVGV